jgi:hypothetical protein
LTRDRLSALLKGGGEEPWKGASMLPEPEPAELLSCRRPKAAQGTSPSSADNTIHGSQRREPQPIIENR